ncbi:unannotated protein [freshwater metagenome]|uniref:Unannotated protein n=1 Tax=freshwater metagenome TaxID=449393 RepID=A0A6J7EBD1_9ZZZZ|nr:hypothetical protein [Actinomycetota bacterium]
MKNIYGWSDRGYEAIRQIERSAKSGARPTVEIHATVASEDIYKGIKERIGELKHTRVFVKRGTPEYADDFLYLNPSAPFGESSFLAKPNGDVYPFSPDEIAARTLVHTACQPGYAEALNELFDLGSDEIFFHRVPQLLGQRYDAAISSFEKACVIGIRKADGKVLINPPITTIFHEGEEIIAISADENSIVYQGVKTQLTDIQARKKSASRNIAKPVHVLIEGWSEYGEDVVAELIRILPRASSIHIHFDPEKCDAQTIPARGVKAITITSGQTTGTKKYSHVIALAYRSDIGPNEADHRTIEAVKKIKAATPASQNTSFTVELFDPSKACTLELSENDCLFAIENFAAKLIAQIWHNPDLTPVLSMILSPAGPSISFEPIDSYVAPGRAYTFARIAAAAATRGDSPIGYFRAMDGVKVLINPSKATIFDTKPGDKLIVIAN